MVENIIKILQNSISISIFKYHKLNSNQINDLRKNIKKNNIKLIIVKNSLLKISLKKIKLNNLLENIKFDNIILCHNDNPGLSLRVFDNFLKKIL
ncbi:50S ribosomal protein L10 [Candidatus Nardonella dryophthoridicola]|uniref:50S ribosomal protein L10 n=1 Tax=Candidatus Nardonella dryophthoridicola TaxID=1971485 RepID=UPI003B973D1D